ncbi:MAG: hypothetical protein QOD41_60 [Cryptosporangiaceae bacterium]|nr:hypothetical protein [Cryptosporangiaceae bacterium]
MLPRGRRAVIAGIVLSLAVSGAALAYWTAAGSGSAPAAAATATSVTVTPGIPSAALYPGGIADVALSVSNPNSFTARVGALTLDTSQGTSGYTADAGHSSCSVAALTFTAQSNAGLGWAIPPRTGGTDGTLAIDLTNSLAMAASAADACQGATFTVYLHAEPDYQTTILSTTGLVSYWRLGTGPAAADSFTGSTGTALTAHTSETATAWTHQGGTATQVITPTGRIRKNGAGGMSLDYTSTTPPSPDYTVEADLYNTTSLAGDELGLVARLSTAASTYYKAWFNRADNGWYLTKVTAGGTTSLGCYCAYGALTPGQAYRLRLDISGSATTTLKLYLDGILRLTGTDSSSPYTAAGKAGLITGSTGSAVTQTDSTGIHADNYRLIPAVTTTVTDSKGTSTGTFTGTPLLSEPGAITGDYNRAARLNGTDAYATIPHNATLNTGNGPFTLEAWVRRNDNGTAKQTLLGKGTGDYQWAFSNNKIGLYKDGTGLIAESTGTQLDTTTFHHYAVTKTGATTHIYIDGTDVTATITDQTLTDTATALTIGGRGSNDLLNGTIDETALYNTVLTPTTINNHYHLGLGS